MTPEQINELHRRICDCILEKFTDQLKPWFEQVKINTSRLDELEKICDPSDVAAMINTLQALQARVRELEFEMARLSHKSEGVMEPSPWGESVSQVQSIR